MKKVKDMEIHKKTVDCSENTEKDNSQTTIKMTKREQVKQRAHTIMKMED